MIQLIIGFILGAIFGIAFVVGMILVHFHDKLQWTVRFCPYVRWKYGAQGWKDYRSSPCIGDIINNLSPDQSGEMGSPAETEENKYL